MAIERIWFPKDPDGQFDATDRARLSIGYGNIPVMDAVNTVSVMRVVHEEIRAVKAVMQ